MINAKDELLEELERIEDKVKCAAITYAPCETTPRTIKLRSNYSEAEWQEFLDQLDFEYDDWNGTQKLFGYVWLSDGTWLERWVAHEVEHWEHQESPGRYSRKQCPPIPPELIG